MATNKVKGKVGRPKKVKELEVVHKVQFNITDEWISLICDPEKADKPSISELHSIIKHSLVILEAVSGFDIVTILTKIHEDVQKNVKDRYKCLAEDWPQNKVKDMYKLKNDSFKMYKGRMK